MEFEMAYQTRVAIDRIRFAIKHTEQFVFERDRLLKAANEGTQYVLDRRDRTSPAL
jgi:hypothetical protein